MTSIHYPDLVAWSPSRNSRCEATSRYNLPEWHPGRVVSPTEFVWPGAFSASATLGRVSRGSMKEPSESEIRRVSFVLSQFVKPWALPLNPENLELMAYCALKYGLDSSASWADIEEFVAGEVQRDEEEHERIREAMRK